jgi:hypothetical protein
MNDVDRRSEELLERKARGVFEHSVAELDGGTRARLTRARLEALRSLDERPRSELARPRAWLAAVAAAAAAISFAWLLSDGGSDAPPQSAEVVAVSPDGELLLDDEELDMLEDLEFYTWLDEQTGDDVPDAAGDGIG